MDLEVTSNSQLYSSSEHSYFVKPVWGELNYLKFYKNLDKVELDSALQQVLAPYNLSDAQITELVNYAIANKVKFEKAEDGTLSEFVYAMY